MIIQSIQINNFRSFGDTNNILYLEDDVTTVVGMNECGKTNALKALGELNVFGDNAKLFSDYNSNLNSKKPISFSLLYKIRSNELDKWNYHNPDITSKLYVKDNFTCSISGSIAEIYKNSLKGQIIDLINYFSKFNKLNGQNLETYNIRIAEFKKDDNYDIKKMNNAFVQFQYICDNYIPQDDKMKQNFDTIKYTWLDFIKLFPSICYRSNDAVIKTEYTLNEVTELLKNKSDPLSEFVKIIGIENDKFVLAVAQGTNDEQMNIRDEIRENTEKFFNDKFNKFYNSEVIHLSPRFSDGKVKFLLKSNEGKMISLSERSNGLRWYINLYIDILYKNLSETNNVFVFDEPGIFLHINAQNKLVDLIWNLSKYNQVLYSTHSPNMISTKDDRLMNIRMIVKDERGFSQIAKNCCSMQASDKIGADVLSPVISAMGMPMNNFIAFDFDKINIITEGISDYNYLCLGAKLCNFNLSKYAIIPSNGAADSVKVAEILYGWNCKFITLYDFDKAGVESGGEKLKKLLGLNYRKEIIFTNNANENEIIAKDYLDQSKKHEIENVVTTKEIENFKNQNGINCDDKRIVSRLMYLYTIDGKWKCSNECIQNFQSLLNNLENAAKSLNESKENV